ncbi:hypothetical protein LTR09_007213 [Extremus antarcticus]|uniref:Uncharacterized protein n=1 Tax=Extremus antarcticus TaxID=702011 RepID=A0AAJ0DD20_9PEZI|nr:hypothetical protein LTR09_007213 [Extremus antarcticus]
METRSQRRAAQTQRPSYPQATTQSASQPSSVFQSSASISTMNAGHHYSQQQQQPHMLQTHQPGMASAPLPSPSASQPSAYFGSISQQAPTSHPNQLQQQRIPQGQAGTGSYLGQRGDGGGTPETAPFLKDFNLVAEAAKRAQMACLARDMGDVGL